MTSDEVARYTTMAGMAPEDFARTFFEACAREDWAEVAKFRNGPPDAQFRAQYGGLRIISLGKPFRGAMGRVRFGDVFVPYEIRLKDGRNQKWQIAVRCDNPERHWLEDGGI